jgi:hypothetical protein
LASERTMPTERLPLVGEVVQTFEERGVARSAQRIPTVVNLGFLDRSRYFFFQVAPKLSSRGWVDHVPDPLLLRKSWSAGNRARDLWICSKKLWPQRRSLLGYWPVLDEEQILYTKSNHVGFDVFEAVVMKSIIFWDMTACIWERIFKIFAPIFPNTYNNLVM